MSDAKGLGGRKHMVLGEPKENRQPESKKQGRLWLDSSKAGFSLAL